MGAEVVALGGSFGGDASLLRTADGLANATAEVELRAGRSHAIAIKARAGPNGPMRLRLAWITPDAEEQARAAAVAAARSARTAIVVAWDEAGEGHDRPALDLPWQQDRLIAAVAGANPRTIVVLTTAAPVLMPWLARTAAVLETWYPGVAGAEALAAILLGEADPGGRLPVTFPADPGRTPTSSPERYPGIGGVADYREGVLVGYRWYDVTGTEPLFPFGYGLSYTRFAYRDLAVTAHADGWEVAFTVRNIGPRFGSEVAQLYLGPPDGVSASLSPRQLAGFAKIGLAPGEQRRLTLPLDRQAALSYWSSERGAWVPALEARPIEVGASSRDIGSWVAWLHEQRAVAAMARALGRCRRQRWT